MQPMPNMYWIVTAEDKVEIMRTDLIKSVGNKQKMTISFQTL